MIEYLEGTPDLTILQFTQVKRLPAIKQKIMLGSKFINFIYRCSLRRDNVLSVSCRVHSYFVNILAVYQ